MSEYTKDVLTAIGIHAWTLAGVNWLVLADSTVGGVFCFGVASSLGLFACLRKRPTP